MIWLNMVQDVTLRGVDRGMSPSGLLGVAAGRTPFRWSEEGLFPSLPILFPNGWTERPAVRALVAGMKGLCLHLHARAGISFSV